MTPELFLDEYRNFKFLKSSCEFVDHTKDCRIKFNQVRPLDQVDNNSFTWSSRIEFFEQLLDMRDGEIYIVEPGELIRTAGPDKNTNVSFSYEPARLHQIVKPRLIYGHPITGTTVEVTLDDIPALEDSPGIESQYFICSEQGLEFGPTHINFRIFGLRGIPLIPGSYFSYTAIFYTLYEAEAYKQAITSFLRKNAGAISAISNLI